MPKYDDILTEDELDALFGGPTPPPPAQKPPFDEVLSQDEIQNLLNMMGDSQDNQTDGNFTQSPNHHTHTQQNFTQSPQNGTYFPLLDSCGQSVVEIQRILMEHAITDADLAYILRLRPLVINHCPIARK